ncbi:MAG: hypothetical protein FJW35_12810 [Acidobacteria bacterium]|nr:hypothetical protein [Acidobacteriota bacterium]
MVEYQAPPGRKHYVLVRRPLLGLFMTGRPISILINPSVAHDPWHPEYYTPVPITSRVASSTHRWAWPALFFGLALPILALRLLSLLRPRRFRVFTRFHFDPRP